MQTATEIDPRRDLVTLAVLHHGATGADYCFPHTAEEALVFVLDVLLEIEHLYVAQQRFDVTGQLRIIGLSLDNQLAIATAEIELAIGRGKIIQLSQIHFGSTKTHLEIVHLKQGIEGCLHLHRRMAQQLGSTVKTSVTRALYLSRGAEVQHRHVQVVGVDIDLRFRAEITESDSTVDDLELVDLNQYLLTQPLAPVHTFTGLAITFDLGIDKVQLGVGETHTGYQCMMVPQGPPAQGNINTWGDEEWRLHIADILLDVQPVNAVGTAPPVEINILDMPGVVTHLRHVLVHHVANQS